MAVTIEHTITIKHNNDNIVLTKQEAEDIFSALSVALNKTVYPNTNNIWYSPNTRNFNQLDCGAVGAQ